MKVHRKMCPTKEQPCPLEHEYYCAECGEVFETSAETHYQQSKRHPTLPCMFWPACSWRCYMRRYETSKLSNPNQLSWADLSIKLSKEEDTSEVIDLLDQDHLDILERVVLEDIMDNNPLESREEIDSRLNPEEA